mmetsp:Transcript_30881/g.104003  ORF Transcript_30881/g.104003 Transcript_30881/m.104003 type:complete len:217 (-) Transcript_30881:173-823(-)
MIGTWLMIGRRASKSGVVTERRPAGAASAPVPVEVRVLALAPERLVVRPPVARPEAAAVPVQNVVRRRLPRVGRAVAGPVSLFAAAEARGLRPRDVAFVCDYFEIGEREVVRQSATPLVADLLLLALLVGERVLGRKVGSFLLRAGQRLQVVPPGRVVLGVHDRLVPHVLAVVGAALLFLLPRDGPRLTRRLGLGLAVLQGLEAAGAQLVDHPVVV